MTKIQILTGAIIVILTRIVNKGLYDDLEKLLIEISKLTDDELLDDVALTETLLIELEKICEKFYCGEAKYKPDCEARPILCKLLNTLCKDWLPKLRYRLNPPPTEGKKPEITKKKSGRKM